ncbi:MAG TPA: TrmJ/YjtD family RNA methyltransferase [Bryobacteraceae bacterium]|nr:TrmJ/YjtD family RNA methyltransferase [Bryobacteraceae bacterium]
MSSGDPRDNLRVVLVDTRNPLNIGAAARAMANFGVAHLRVVNPYEVAFREARSAVGGASLLAAAEEFPTLGEALADCVLVVGTTAGEHRELQHHLHRLESGGRLIREQLDSGAVALVFGSEKFGLSNQEMSYCHWLVRIPTVPDTPSMNLGQAVAVCLYELVRQPESTAPATHPFKSGRGEDIEQLTRMLLEVLDRSGYIQPRTAASSADKLRRLIRRLHLSARDTPVLLGMVRQILWKISTTRNTE